MSYPIHVSRNVYDFFVKLKMGFPDIGMEYDVPAVP
jgi:hypothetical protein